MFIQHARRGANRQELLSDESPAFAQAELDDDQLIDAVRRGDSAAYGTLVHKYEDRLCGAISRLCGSLADAQDAAQEAFLRAYLKLPSFSRSSTFYTWLYRIAVNALLSQRRRRRAVTVSERTFEVAVARTADRSPQPDERLLGEQRAQEVQQALASLSGEHRAILVLREIEDCDYDEIADILNVPVGTVRSRLHRARLQLREKLAPLTR